ncbi:MAG: phosphotransferase, partial [Steroidobacteraceae bacterium]
MKEQPHPFDSLVPELIIEAVESVGLACNGRLLALGSYENRVYQVGLEDADPVVVKFYRPGRWSLEAILEEHEFSAELQAAEVPVVGPLRLATEQGRNTLHGIKGFHFAV